MFIKRSQVSRGNTGTPGSTQFAFLKVAVEKPAPRRSYRILHRISVHFLGLNERTTCHGPLLTMEKGKTTSIALDGAVEALDLAVGLGQNTRSQRRGRTAMNAAYAPLLASR
jgi:hypothetical protein